MVAIPVMPANRTAPTKALAQIIAAPVPTGTIPTVVVPAVLAIAEKELRLLHQAQTVRSYAQLGRLRVRRRLRDTDYGGCADRGDH
jgi:hypothetical protein